MSAALFSLPAAAMASSIKVTTSPSHEQSEIQKRDIVDDDIRRKPTKAKDLWAAVRRQVKDKTFFTLTEVIQDMPWTTDPGWWEEVIDIEFRVEIDGPERRKTGRAAIFNFSNSESPPETFRDPGKLYFRLKELLDSKKSGYSGRWMIVLEDLGGDWVEMLGAVLKIPVSFFELHWADPMDHVRGTKRTPLGTNPLQHCVLGYTELHEETSILKEPDTQYWVACNARRPIYFEAKSGGVTTEQLLSYWAVGFNNPEAWISLILVDPKLRSYKWENAKGEAGAERCQIDNFHAHQEATSFRLSRPPPTFEVLQEDSTKARLVLGSGQGTSKFLTTDQSKFSRTRDFKNYPFDVVSYVLPPLHPTQRDHFLRDKRDASTMIGKLFTADPRQNIVVCSGTENAIMNPASSMYLCCRFILQKTAAAINSVLQKTVEITIESSTGKDIKDFGMDSYDNGAWLSKWRGSKFKDLWEYREDIEILRLKLDRTIRTFEKFKKAELLQEKDKGINTVHGWDPKIQVELDFEELMELERQGAYIHEMIERSIQSYLQTVSAGEAQVANNQARSVNTLTALATLALPFGVIAAIFAIPGAVSPGSVKFWIYWAIAVPFSFLIVVLLLSPIGRGIGKFCRRSLRQAFSPIKKWFEEGTGARVNRRLLRRVPDFLKHDEESLYELRKRDD